MEKIVAAIDEVRHIGPGLLQKGRNSGKSAVIVTRKDFGIFGGEKKLKAATYHSWGGGGGGRNS